MSMVDLTDLSMVNHGEKWLPTLRGHRGTSNYSNTSPVPRLRGTGTEKNQKGDRFRGWLQKPIEKKNGIKRMKPRNHGKNMDNPRFSTGDNRISHHPPYVHPQPRFALEEQVGFHFQAAILVAVDRNDHIQNPQLVGGVT